MTKVSAMLFIISLADVTIVNFQTRHPLLHYLPVFCIWNLQFFLSLTTLAVSLMLNWLFPIPCLLLLSLTCLDRQTLPLTTCLQLHSRWFPLFLPLLCSLPPALWPWLNILRLLGHSPMLQSLSVLSLCRPQVLRPALPLQWLLGSILAGVTLSLRAQSWWKNGGNPGPALPAGAASPGAHRQAMGKGGDSNLACNLAGEAP